MTKLSQLYAWFYRICADPNDSADEHAEKMIVVSGGLIIVLVGTVAFCLYRFFGERLAASIALGYPILASANIALFILIRNYALFRFIQFSFMLLLPYLLMVALGGFVNSSAVILWALLAPLGALLSSRSRKALWWLLAYLLLLVSGPILQPYFPAAGNVSPRAMFILFVLNVGAVSVGAFLMVDHFVVEVKIFQEKSDNLLLNILPKDVVRALKNQDQTIAEHYDGASILFADMVNFTPLSAGMRPVEVVELLNDIFSVFDSLVEKHGLEKIKTMGDCYMVASGVPRRRPDHAQAILRLALDINDCLQRQAFNTVIPVAFRIGVNSGPVMAGVIGRKKFIYDLWGDAVNTASRMQSHGTAGRIQITSATYDLVKHDFACEPVGAVHVKGKGEMDVWFVTGHKRNLTLEASS